MARARKIKRLRPKKEIYHKKATTHEAKRPN
jgi:hypothetical protein